jgi:hypothetical protein
MGKYRLHIMVQCMCYTELWIHWFSDPGATIPNDSITIGWTSLVGVCHLRSNSIVPLMLRTICCAMAGALALYYRSLETVPTLLRRGNISGIPCMRFMTYNALAFSALKQLGNYRWFYTISFENPKTY